MPDTRPLLDQIHKLQARKPYNFYSILLALEKTVPQYFMPTSNDFMTENELCHAIRQQGSVTIENTEQHLTYWTLTKHYVYKP